MCIILILFFSGFPNLDGFDILDILDFEIILGMTWLSVYHLILNYNAKTMALEMPRIYRLE